MARDLGQGPALFVEVQRGEAVGVGPVAQLMPGTVRLLQQRVCLGHIPNMDLNKAEE